MYKTECRYHIIMTSVIIEGILNNDIKVHLENYSSTPWRGTPSLMKILQYAFQGRIIVVYHYKGKYILELITRSMFHQLSQKSLTSDNESNKKITVQ